MANLKYFYSIALPAPLRKNFIYASDRSAISAGTRVSVPFGNQKAVMGVVTSSIQKHDISSEKLRSIHAVLEERPSLPPRLLALCRWCSDYYHYPLGEVCHIALPTLLRKPESAPDSTRYAWKLTTKGAQMNITELKRAHRQQAALALFQMHKKMEKAECSKRDISTTIIRNLLAKGLIEEIEITPSDSAYPLSEGILNEQPLTLNNEQQHAVNVIDTDKFGCYLIEGVTGSGKTEIYLQVMESVLRKNQQILVLVPEIGLTDQTLARFKSRFQLPVAVLHSGLNDKQRFELWQQASHNQLPIVIGTRSSVFTPLQKLGLIIVDEEHDLSYKQQDGVRYSARDLAIVHAQKSNIPLLLGSATPSLESLHNATSGRYQHLELHHRANRRPLPEITCIAADDQHLAEETQQAIERTLNQGQQVLVFINRRGYAPTLMCPDCGWISQCQRCDNRMTLHRSSNQGFHQGPRGYLHCHSCDCRGNVPKNCPYCCSQHLQALGSGTQRGEEQLLTLFPNTRVLRIDSDSISRKGQWQAVLEQIHSEEPCIIIGTQMLAKGHHFRNLGLAIILGLDSAFFSSDFRGSERMGQLVTQVAGRVGREQRQGTVLIQTRFGDHPMLQELINAGYHRFAQTLLAERQITTMPPWQYLALIRCHGPQADASRGFLEEVRHLAECLHPAHLGGIQYLGPFPATPEKRNNRFHNILQIRTAERRERHRLLQKLCAQLEQKKLPSGLHWLVDVDPQEF